MRSQQQLRKKGDKRKVSCLQKDTLKDNKLKFHFRFTYQQCQIKHSIWQQILVEELMRRRPQTSLEDKQLSAIRCLAKHAGSIKSVMEVHNKPNMEKKNIKAVDICTTLLLPMCVNPRRPTFSLQYHLSVLVK